MLNRYFALIFSLIFAFSVQFCAFADVSTQDKSSRYVTEYYDEALFSDVVDVAGDVDQTGLKLCSKSAILIERSTGQVLYEYNADEVLPPASITKIMTMLLVCEALDSHKITLDTQVICSDHAASMGGSQIWLEPGESMIVNDLLKAVAVGSANDASVALAEAVAGSEEAFVQMMNNKAKTLKMTNTCFVNACGLDESGHYSTARDIAIMSAELLRHDIIRNYTKIWMDSLRNGETELVNTNKLVRFYKDCTGLKTGTTNGAGHCLSASAMRDNMELIAVVLGAKSSNERFSDAKKLLEHGFANFKIVTPMLDKSKIGEMSVEGGQMDKVKLSHEKLGSILQNKGDGDVMLEIKKKECVKAPVKRGQVLGKIIIRCGEKKIDELKICAAQDVEKKNFPFMFLQMLKSFIKI